MKIEMWKSSQSSIPVTRERDKYRNRGSEMERSEIERIEEIYIGNAGTQEKMGTSMSGLSAFSQDGQK